MKRFNKESIKRIIQSFLLGYTVCTGFLFIYLFIWYCLDLPDNCWTLVPTLLAGASAFGLFHWIVKS